MALWPADVGKALGLILGLSFFLYFDTIGAAGLQSKGCHDITGDALPFCPRTKVNETLF
jgi:hypothetical protein